MTRTQIENKIADLDFWLTHNQSHPDYSIILKDKQNLETKLLEEANE